MNTFEMFTELGFRHITDVQGYDHIIFLIALCGVYTFRDWKKLLTVITIFTITHSLSLALAAFDVVKPKSEYIEFLIPITILLTAIYNVSKYGLNRNGNAKVYISGLFGLVHGFGFSGFYRMIMMDAKPWYESYLPFNLGIEIGQIAIVLVVLLLSAIFQQIFKVTLKSWNIFIGGGVSFISITLIVKTWPF